MLSERARQAGAAAMPSYTHLQRAEPVLVAHWLLAYAEMFLRDADRFRTAVKGSTAVRWAAGRLPVRRCISIASPWRRRWDFSPTANSMDATSDRDFAVEFAQVLSLLAVHLSRWAEEFILFSTLEYGFVLLPESYSTGRARCRRSRIPTRWS